MALYVLNEKPVENLSLSDAGFRNRGKVGFIFQSFQSDREPDGL